MFSDATTYAHFLFNAFAMDRSGSIRFEASSPPTACLCYKQNRKVNYEPFHYFFQDFVIGLSVLLRGSVTEKLRWAFNLYDINKDGYITREVHSIGRSCFLRNRAEICGSRFVCLSGFLQEMMAIMTSIYDMMGRCTHPMVRDDSPYEHVEKFFQVFYLCNHLTTQTHPWHLNVLFYYTHNLSASESLSNGF